VGPGNKINIQLDSETIQSTKKIINTLQPGIVETIPSPWLGFLRGVFLANHLATTDNLTRNNQKSEHIPTKTNNT